MCDVVVCLFLGGAGSGESASGGAKLCVMLSSSAGNGGESASGSAKGMM